LTYLIVILRLIHILSGVFWVGSTIFLSFFVMPTIQATAGAGQKFLIYLVAKRPLGVAIDISARLTAIAGGFLYWIDSDGLTSGWLYSGPGWGFGIGGLFGLIGLIFDMLAVKQIKILSKTVSIQGEPPLEQMDHFRSTQKRLGDFSAISGIVLVVALLCMATARYWRL